MIKIIGENGNSIGNRKNWGTQDMIWFIDILIFPWPWVNPNTQPNGINAIKMAKKKILEWKSGVKNTPVSNNTPQVMPSRPAVLGPNSVAITFNAGK